MADPAFGGSWTEEKLERVRKYLRAYTTALKKQPFSLAYIDAFAGTGHRQVRPAATQLGFEFVELEEVAKGSARLAIEVDPRFNSYCFIEKNASNFSALCKLRDEYRDQAQFMRFFNEDANDALLRICQEIDWRRWRAVAFLDPFGMSVNWATLEAIAATKAIDLWYLFPSHMGVGRMLPKDADIPPAWQQRLDKALGTRAWRDHFYREKNRTQATLFAEPDDEFERTFDMTRIEEFMRDRLLSIFAGVGKRALPLSIKNRPAYHLFFAVGNPRAKELALRIASDILTE